MYWTLRSAEVEATEGFQAAGRFVLQRHRDRDGKHLDLRLERDGYLEGWRIDAISMQEECWATAKAPHATRWLDNDGDTVRVDAGEYAWESTREDGGTLLLKGAAGWKRIEVSSEAGISATIARNIRTTLKAHDLAGDQAVGLIEDGLTARRNAVERLCGLGALLDDDAFEDGLWRKTLSGLSLGEIHSQLRGFELRFDRRYPPEPVSKPEALSDASLDKRSEVALTILHA